MAALDLITLADFKAYRSLKGPEHDSLIAHFITAASREIESDLGRRIVYRAPPEVDGAANVASQVDLANGALTIAAQPDPAGRTLIVTFTDADRSVSAGKLTATGTVAGQAEVTETFDIADGPVQHGAKFFSSLDTLVVSGVTGTTAGADKVQVGTSVGYVEYHTPFGSELLPLEWPSLSILEVNEDPGRAYGGATKLATGSEYLLTRGQEGQDRLLRTSSLLPTAWSAGWRAVRVTHAAGYRVAAVPEEIKDICRRLVALLYDEITQGRLGMSSRSDAAGNWTRFAPARLTAEMRTQLAAQRRFRFGTETGERDFSLEAA